jgi:hypothetical protein
VPFNASQNSFGIFSYVSFNQRKEALNKTNMMKKELKNCEVIRNTGIKIAVSFTIQDISGSKNGNLVDRIMEDIDQNEKEMAEKINRSLEKCHEQKKDSYCRR